MIAGVSTFVPLTTERVAALVAANPRLAAVTGAGELTATEVGDGNLNQVFVVRARGSASPGIVLKQALPYLRVAGEGWPLTRERMRFETQSLLLYNETVPGFAPLVYDRDADQSWVAMEYLAGHRIMRQAVLAGDELAGVGRDLGEFVAAIAYTTSEMSLDAPTKRARAVEFSNPGLCHLQEDFVFTNPFFESPENEWNPALDADVRDIRSDRALKVAIAAAKAHYMSRGEALLHGDLHTGSVMIACSRGDPPDTKVIDPEFAFYGPIAHDIGTIVAHLAIGALAHAELTHDVERRQTIQQRLVTEIGDVWRGFVDGIERRWHLESSGDLASPDYWGDDHDGFVQFRNRHLADIAANIGRHGGCELLRRCMGIVSVAELEAIEDHAARARVERSLIAVAREWLLGEPPLRTTLDRATEHLIIPVERAASLTIGSGR